MNRLRMLLFIGAVLTALAVAPRALRAGEEGAAQGTAGKPAGDDVMHVMLRASLASPLFSAFPVAEVNGETITLEELKAVVFSSHEERLEQQLKAPAVSFGVFLDRLITVRLFAQEAKNVGLADLPEIKSAIENFSKTALRNIYMAELLKDVKANPEEVEQSYKDSVREWKIQAAMFPKEEDAKKMEADLKSGKSFEETVARAIKEGTAQGQAKSDYVKGQALQPQVAGALSRMSVGSVSPVIAIGGGKERRFSLIKLEDVRYPDDHALRASVEREALSRAKRQSLEKYAKEWSRKNARINKKLLAGLDYESTKPGADQLMEKLRKDQRTLAEIRGEKPVTVADMTAAITGVFYHGQESMKLKHANKEKERVLTDIITKRMLEHEGLKSGTQNGTTYKAAVADYETTLLFNTFVTKVIAPEVSVSEERKKRYYQEHLGDFTASASMKLSNLAFQNVKDAERALEKLKKGAAFSWMKENAEGQVDEKVDVMRWNDDLVTLTDLPADLRSALSGAKAGDFRLATAPEGYYYVFAVKEVTPPSAFPFEEVASIIAQRAAGEELDRIAKEWAEKLRQSSEIKVYLVESRK